MPDYTTNYSLQKPLPSDYYDIAVPNSNMDALDEALQAQAARLDEKVDKIEGKGLSQNDYTTAEKQKLAGLENYTLPIAGVALGGVKNGGNVTVNADGTMTASTSNVERVNLTADDPRWGDAQAGVYTLSIAGDKIPLGVYRKDVEKYSLVAAGIAVGGGNVLVTSLDKFDGYLMVI